MNNKLQAGFLRFYGKFDNVLMNNVQAITFFNFQFDFFGKSNSMKNTMQMQCFDGQLA